MLDEFYQFLARMGFSDPLHPPITHLPIGLTVGALVFFLSAYMFRQKNFIVTARQVSILAFIFAFPTILLGVFDWIHFYHAMLFTPIIIKMILATVLLFLLGAGIILGSEVKVHPVFMSIIYILAFIAVFGLGYFGTNILYGRGLLQKTAVIEHSSAIITGSGAQHLPGK